MITREKAPGGRPGAGTMRRRHVGAFSLTSSYSIADVRTNVNPQFPPGHLTPDEARLWAAAEAVRGNDPIEYRERRRRLLLAQAERYQPVR